MLVSGIGSVLHVNVGKNAVVAGKNGLNNVHHVMFAKMHVLLSTRKGILKN